jgi:uncharacterized protein (DUF1697 family)
MKFIAFIRGINVGRKNRIKMADLVKALDLSGLKNIKTYLQSGNIIFEHDNYDNINISRDIERKISQDFGISVNVIIRREDELETIIELNPFIKDPDIEHSKLHVTYLKEIPDKDLILNLGQFKGKNEDLKVNNKEIYLYLPNGYAKTKLTNEFFEKKLKTISTTRNWKTTTKILEIAKYS